tara:strand:- start:1647 stop:2393 length:747 start_codon:yes stop_codon:yes gene_type:complete
MVLLHYITLFIILSSLVYTNTNLLDRAIIKTTNEYEKVKDFQAQMTVELNMPGIRIPKKTYKVYFKQPNKFKADTKGFGMLPNTGVFTSPKDNFDNLKNLEIGESNPSSNGKNILITGEIIPDSLKAQFPSEYAKLTFDPLVDVLIDTTMWVIKSVISRIDTLKLFEITNNYKLYDNQYYLPFESQVKYFIKDARLAGWLKKDMKTLINPNNQKSADDVIRGVINVNYLNYKINTNLPDRIFKKKKSD